MTAPSANKIAGITDLEIEEHLTKILVEQFEVEPEKISPEAHLFDDLGIDSIDAVDMLVYLKEFTGMRIPPEDFQSVRTLGDVVGVVKTLRQQC